LHVSGRTSTRGRRRREKAVVVKTGNHCGSWLGRDERRAASRRIDRPSEPTHAASSAVDGRHGSARRVVDSSWRVPP
jgi:hypothetical protein